MSYLFFMIFTPELAGVMRKYTVAQSVGLNHVTAS